MGLVKRKTRKAIKKQVGKVIKKQGPQIAAALAGSVLSSLATMLSADSETGKKAKKKLTNTGAATGDAVHLLGNALSKIPAVQKTVDVVAETVGVSKKKNRPGKGRAKANGAEQ